ncbi:hypothetical protein FSP39_020893 [Pinctada imbricata]|uniref:Endonuclease V n=1 Tax=Pinctada imbricata TaxID=66713 RepID=A0AA89C970_PINIB|nr:hypothetical protein FSP39_020893 [Pinctada imbricata]
MDFCDDCGGVKESRECGKCDSDPVQREDVPQDVKDKWEKEQDELKKKLILEDAPVIQEMKESMEHNKDMKFYIGGVDISFVKGDLVNACSAFVVCSFPDLEKVYEDYEMVKLTQPYIPGYLAFREVDFMIQQYNKLKTRKPEYLPHVIMVDGNGIIHPKEFGCACQLGVLLDIPCIGSAKKLFQVDGLEKDEHHQEKIKNLSEGGDSFPLIGDSGRQLGVALRSCNKTTNPIFVSPGHKISIASAEWLVYKCCKYRIPEPVRQADIGSREYLRQNFKHDEPT